MMYNTPYQARRRRNPLARIIFLLIVLGGIGFFVYKLQTGNVIPVDAGTTLFMHNCNGGYIHIHAGTATNQVVLHGLGGLFTFPTHAQDSDTVIINGSNNCAMDMTVPATINLDIDMNGGEITVFGVSGQMKLSTNGGSITLMGDTLKGTSVLSNNGGPIVFQGSLDSTTTSKFSNNGSSIDITLPSNASFHLKTQGILGSFTSNYPGIASTNTGSPGIPTAPGIPTTPGIPATGTGLPDVTIGKSPQATLTLDLNDTAVILRKG